MSTPANAGSSPGPNAAATTAANAVVGAVKKVANASANAASKLTGQLTASVNNASKTLADAAATATTATTGSSSWMPVVIGVLVVVAIALIAWLSGALGQIRAKIANRPTPENNVRIADSRAEEQTRIADSLAQQHSAILDSAGGAVSAKPDPAAAGLADIPDDEEALINFHVLGARNAGYLGPYENGVFDETRAVRLALRKGVRLFVFEIDYLSRDPETPVLVCRDGAGNLISNNTGRIRRVAEALKAFTKDQAAAGTDPIILLLSARRLPAPKPAAGATDPENIKARMRFMAAIAGELAPIYPWMLKGEYARQQAQGQLFKQPIGNFKNAFIVLSNLDTRDFRAPDLPVYITPKQDLDMMINARVYATQESGGPPGYGLPAQSDINVSAHANTYAYYTSIPTDKLDAAKTTATTTWSVAISPNGTPTPSKEDLQMIMDRIGVQGIAVDIFDEQATLAPLYDPTRFKKFSYVAKPTGARFKDSAPVQMGPSNSATDVNGGNLSVPAP